jgi:hypothetical protein
MKNFQIISLICAVIPPICGAIPTASQPFLRLKEEKGTDKKQKSRIPKS